VIELMAKIYTLVFLALVAREVWPLANAEIGDWVTWPTKAQLSDLEVSILDACRAWIDRQEQWKQAFVCGKKIYKGEFVKEMIK